MLGRWSAVRLDRGGAFGGRGTDGTEDEQHRRRHLDPHDPPHERLQATSTCRARREGTESCPGPGEIGLRGRITMSSGAF
jgi:hypothetical protein